ncbi:hypothetical protein BDQ12DRAFT_654462 [Crucibulum laeve]|uniref:RING-type domain-containing protein n=1 Tax=Crucibulum laeve TaxID=68775 RepID=A0A5C3LWW3_9AGAR|nr:hypothetical protein BDQ12DRAFT_654462 [Crucibulum laeve]
MDIVGVVGDVVAEPEIHRFPLTGTYNISLNFNSLLSFLPSKLLGRIMKKGLESPIVDSTTGSVIQLEQWASATPTNHIASGAQPILLDEGNADAPWSFLTSGYMLGLFLMAILLHRLQNLIIPSRTLAQRRRRVRDVSFGNALLFRRIFASILPIDLSNATVRLAIHLPSLYFISKALLLWVLVILQTSDLYPGTETTSRWGLTWIGTLGAWSRQKEMSEICWSTFCAICGAFLVEGLVKALSGIGGGFPIGGHANPNTAPFNLVGYAFFLHVYSSPHAHAFILEGLPSRPDSHILVTIAIPLLQLTMFHYLSASKRYSNHRLIPTTIISAISLTHFYYTLFTHFLYPSRAAISPSITMDGKPPLSSRANSSSRPVMVRTHPLRTPALPLLNYVPNIFDTMLILTIALTVILNVVVQLLVSGRVERVFSGLGLIPGDDSGFRIPYDEDFGIFLLRIGTASLEATGLRGWGNEVAPIPAPIYVHHANHPHHSTAPSLYGTVQMNRTGVTAVTDSVNLIQGRKKPKGLRNEVRNMDLGIGAEAAQPSGRWKWLREIWLFVNAISGVMRGLVTWAWTVARHGPKAFRRRERVDRRGTIPGELATTDDAEGEHEEDDGSVYDRFLRGENITDDEDDEGQEYDAEDIDDVELETDEEGESEPEAEAVQLFSDLMRTTGGEMALAHLVHGSSTASASLQSGPLTRRRWGALFTGGGVSTSKEGRSDEPIYSRMENEDRRKERDVENAKHWCVVCTVESREIICWPCRCLTMCDNCREAIAARSTPSKHRCPCCRQTVEGYSRIYIP